MQPLIAASDRLRDSVRKLVSADQQRAWQREIAVKEHTQCPAPFPTHSQRELLLSFLEYNAAHLVGNYRKGVAASVLSSPSLPSTASLGAFDWTKFLVSNLDGHHRYASAVASTTMFASFVQWTLGLERGGKVTPQNLQRVPFLELCAKRFPELYADVLPPEKNSTASATGKFLMSMMSKAKVAVVSTIIGQTSSIPMLEFVQSDWTEGIPAASPSSIPTTALSVGSAQSVVVSIVTGRSLPPPAPVPRLPLDLLHAFHAYHRYLWSAESDAASNAVPQTEPSSGSSSSGKAPQQASTQAPAAALDLFQYVSYPGSQPGVTHMVHQASDVEEIRRARGHKDPNKELDRFFQ
jgi:hypothetical protein